jgi:hypothetical protein
MQPSTLVSPACVLFSVLYLIPARPQTDAPKPGPEHEKLGMLVGDWVFEGESTESVLGPGGKFSGKSSARFIHNGFFVEISLFVKGPWGVLEGTEMRAYDPTSKSHQSYWFFSDGSRIDGTETFSADGFSSEMLLTDTKGRKIPLKARWDFTPDRTAFKAPWEVSTDDGKTWSLFRDYGGRRTGP